MEGRDNGLTRRELLKVAGAAAAAVPLAGSEALAAAVAATTAAHFFTREQLAMVDELSEIIIPADDHSGGARAAKVAEYIDSRLAESFDDEPRQQWKEGLARVDALSQEKKGAPFMQLSPEDRVAIVTLMAAEEKSPTTVEGKFFRELKGRTTSGFYSSSIGLHDDLEYKGNVMQQEYSGIDVSQPQSE
jgi:gluconate 2-dehydrogenase gamma chain